MVEQYSSKLNQIVRQFPTDYWNDSCSLEELSYAVGHGAVGATSNPTIVHTVLQNEMHLWVERIHAMIAGYPTWDETALTWKLIEEMAARAAALLMPAFERYRGKKGRLSIQTNPAFYRNSQAIVDQAVRFNGLAPNMIVKIPVTQAGVEAIEEATFQGVSINATVSFTVPQAIAVAEAVERGLDRRTAAGLPVDQMGPVCTIMVGRTDDWMKVLLKRDGLDVDPTCLDWAGIACTKKADAIYRQRGYRARLLVAAYRHLGHIAEFMGGDLILSMPYAWQLKFNESDIPVEDRMKWEIDPGILAALEKIPDFRRAYAEDGLSLPEFDTYGASVRTLRGFIASAHELTAVVRDFMLPDPDIQPIS